MTIAIACDHGGYDLKLNVLDFLQKNKIAYEDVGCDGATTDYPDIAKLVCDAVVQHDGAKGILICGTGIGMSIAANKTKGIRAALCADHFSTKYTRLHNDSNVMCLGARTLGSGVALELVQTFLETPFEGGRHAVRVDKIKKMEDDF